MNNIRINVFFFKEEEIENDICPTEINSLDDHNQLMNYMQAISKLLGKDVLLTKENYGNLEGALIKVSGDNIFCFN